MRPRQTLMKKKTPMVTLRNNAGQCMTLPATTTLRQLVAMGFHSPGLMKRGERLKKNQWVVMP